MPEADATPKLRICGHLRAADRNVWKVLPPSRI
jgi:hypothetical protein